MLIESAKSEWPLVGNSHIFEFLSKSMEKNSIAGSYVFAGPEDLGKSTAAYFFARCLICEDKNAGSLACGKCKACVKAEKGAYSDIYLIKKPEDKKNISIEQIRDFIRSLGMSSFLNSYKIGIIKGAEAMSESAINALLKTLEEPKRKVVIILTVSNIEFLPKTILSRSQIMNFLPVKSSDIYDDLVKNRKAARSRAKDLSRLAAGRPALALKFLQEREYLEDYEKIARLFFGLLNRDINERFGAINKAVDKKTRPSEAAKTIQIWRNMARDLMLMKLNLPDLIQHERFASELEPAKNRLELKFLLNLIDVLKQSEEYIAANVNPRLAMDSVAAGI